MNNSLKISFFTCLFIFLFTILFFKLFGPLPLYVNSVTTTKTNLFQVTGDGKVAAIPNTAMLSFGVTKQGSNVSDAQNQTNLAIQNITDSIKKLGIEDKNITTANYSVNPNYNYANGNQEITGYTVTQTIDLKITPIEKAAQAIDLITSSGANIVNSLTFTFDDETLKKLQNQARTQAIENAKEKAKALSSGTGMKLGNIVDVQEDNNVPQPVRMTGGLKAMTATSAPTDLPTGESAITSNITLSYETY